MKPNHHFWCWLIRCFLDRLKHECIYFILLIKTSYTKHNWQNITMLHAVQMRSTMTSMSWPLKCYSVKRGGQCVDVWWLEFQYKYWNMLTILVVLFIFMSFVAIFSCFWRCSAAFLIREYLRLSNTSTQLRRFVVVSAWNDSYAASLTLFSMSPDTSSKLAPR